MGASNSVVHVPNREIDWMVLNITCHDRDRCLVAAQDDWTDHSVLSGLVHFINLSLRLYQYWEF